LAPLWNAGKEKTYRFYWLRGDLVANEYQKVYFALNLFLPESLKPIEVLRVLDRETIYQAMIAKILNSYPTKVKYTLDRLAETDVVSITELSEKSKYGTIFYTFDRRVLEKISREHRKKRKDLENWLIGDRRFGGCETVKDGNFTIFQFRERKKDPIDLRLCMNPMAEFLKEMDKTEKELMKEKDGGKDKEKSRKGEAEEKGK